MKPWDDGTTHIVLLAHELIEKLAARMPPPRVHFKADLQQLVS